MNARDNDWLLEKGHAKQCSQSEPPEWKEKLEIIYSQGFKMALVKKKKNQTAFNQNWKTWAQSILK